MSALFAGAVLVGLVAGPARAADSEACLGCHAAMAGSQVHFADGSGLDIGINRETWASSKHGAELSCTDCHREISGYPHETDKDGTARGYQLEASKTCQRCHYAYYTKVLDSIHYAQLEEGNEHAPTCGDCHSPHAEGDVPKLAIQKRCATCHEEISKTYSSSVHGEALTAGNPDVPVCTDCHGAHAIADPREVAFHTRSHEICAGCHGDAERMEPYGLSADVAKTYLDDFHGTSNKLYAMGAGEPGKRMASCSDCHGVHDIKSLADAAPTEVRERVRQMCSNCHGDVPEGFGDAWLSHYEPTFASAPLVWGVRWVYRFMIPGIMLGLVSHILLHLWRVRTHR